MSKSSKKRNSQFAMDYEYEGYEDEDFAPKRYDDKNKRKIQEARRKAQAEKDRAVADMLESENEF